MKEKLLNKLKNKSLLEFENHLLKPIINRNVILDFRFYEKQNSGEIIGYTKPIVIKDNKILELIKNSYNNQFTLNYWSKEGIFTSKDYSIKNILKIFKPISLLDLQYTLIHIKNRSQSI